MNRLWIIFALNQMLALAAASTLTPVWVEAGPEGTVLARVVVLSAADCPMISIDSAPGVPMRPRLPVPDRFRPVCEAKIPAGAKTAVAASQQLKLPGTDPARIVVIGDTGCRLKGERLQDCNNPQAWPFVNVAGAAAAAQPQLVIHVGDYVYRETPCPADRKAQCGGSPSGDTWETWNADFFTPSAKLLQASPWAFSRGNHESCSRSWRGWFYYLDPRPMPAVCPEYSDPYLVTLGGLQLLMVDSSEVDDAKVEHKQLAKYTAELKPYANTQAWLVEHHPLWGLKRDKENGADKPLTKVMEEAFHAAALSGISLILAGHTHLFEVLSFEGNQPPQIIAGDAGTTLATKIEADLKGTEVFGTNVRSGASRQEFGFTLLQNRGDHWDVRLKSLQGDSLVSCTIRGPLVDCGK